MAWRDQLLRRRDRGDRRVRSADRQEGREPRHGAGLCQFALRHPRPDDEAGDRRRSVRADRTAQGAGGRGQAARSPAARAAHQFRPRDDRRHRQLRGDRELQPLPHRPPARRAAADAVRIPARQRAAVRRRKPPDGAADRRDGARAITAARSRWPNTASACRAASTTARCASTNGTRCARRRSRSRPRPGSWEMEQTGRRVRRAGDPPDRADRPAGARSARSRTRCRTASTNAARPPQIGYRTLVTTLTKRMAEDLTEFMHEAGLRVRYMHSDVETLERIELIRDLRLGVYDVLVGINLLREGLDIPECGLVCILDADKEGFLRSRNLADPDHRPRRAQRRRPRDPLCRPHHRQHGTRDGRDRPPPREAARVQRRARHHARQRSSAASRTSSPHTASRDGVLVEIGDPTSATTSSATTCAATSRTSKSACAPPPPTSSSRKPAGCATRSGGWKRRTGPARRRDRHAPMVGPQQRGQAGDAEDALREDAAEDGEIVATPVGALELPSGDFSKVSRGLGLSLWRGRFSADGAIFGAAAALLAVLAGCGGGGSGGGNNGGGGGVADRRRASPAPRRSRWSRTSSRWSCSPPAIPTATR